MSGDAWHEYVGAAQRLAVVRREAAAAADERVTGAEAARERLASVRERLAPQRTRLRERGVPEVDLVPSPPELSIAARSAGRDPAALMVALRAADGKVTAADAALAGRSWRSVRPSGTWRFRSVVVTLALVAGGLLACLALAVLLLLR